MCALGIYEAFCIVEEANISAKVFRRFGLIVLGGKSCGNLLAMNVLVVVGLSTIQTKNLKFTFENNEW